MLLMLLSLLCCVPAAMACLQCDRTIRVLHEDFILSAPTVSDQIELEKIADHAYVTYRATSQARKGVIDPSTLYRAKTEYESEFDRFLNSMRTGPITHDAIQIMEKGRGILEKHLDAFIHDGLCPNKCGKCVLSHPSIRVIVNPGTSMMYKQFNTDGFLNRRVMDCISCRFKIYICPSPTGRQDCGEYPIEAEEGGQAVLNCFRPWHPLLLGKPEYHYSWSPGALGTQQPDESDFAALLVTDESSMVLNQLLVTEQGTYKCSLQDRNGTIFYQVAFLLSVAPLPPQTHQPLVTLPAVPRGDYSLLQPTEELLLSLVAMVIVLSVTASVGLAVVLRRKYILIVRRKKGTEEEKRMV